MANRGTQCCAFGCNKRKKRKIDAESLRSDSDRSSDEESEIKRKFPRTFARKLKFQFGYFRPVSFGKGQAELVLLFHYIH